MGHFLATRPMTSTDMVRSMLKAAGISLLLAWALWAVAFLALYAILLLAHVDPRPQLPSEVGWWYFPITLLGTWIALALFATLGQTGRPSLLASLTCGVPAIAIGVMVFANCALSPAERLEFDRWLAAALGVIFILGTVWAFIAARRRSLIGSPTVWVAMVLWGTLCAGGNALLFTASKRAPALARAGLRTANRTISLGGVSLGGSSAGLGLESQSLTVASKEAVGGMPSRCAAAGRHVLSHPEKGERGQPPD